jgi:hypothetical protein
MEDIFFNFVQIDIQSMFSWILRFKIKINRTALYKF